MDDPPLAKQILRAAQKVATQSECENFRHAALLFRGKKVVSKGTNRLKTHPKGSGYHKRIHAESAAIFSAIRQGIDPSGYNILVVRINKENKLRLSKPCPDCQNLIKEHNIKKIFFSNEKGQVSYAS